MKEKTGYVCKNCGVTYARWVGKCEGCGVWNSIDHILSDDKNIPSKVSRLAEIVLTEKARTSTDIRELDRVLGGGLVLGSVILVGGEPGIGKSTLLMQMLGNLSNTKKVLYVTGEESLEQVALRGKRLGLALSNLYLLAEIVIEKILLTVDQLKPEILVIDSIQTMFCEKVESSPGGISQLKEVTAALIQYGKRNQVSIIIVGHVTKEGTIAGPKILEHMVDCVLYFEGGDQSRYRLLRCVKNRFGAVNEMGIFAMTDIGLKEVNNPSAIFLTNRANPMPGSSITVSMEGTRPILVEMQALVDESFLPNPRRTTVGYDVNRLGMLLAVLNRHGSIHTYNRDIYINVVGGIKILETAADLSLILAVFSSLKNRVLPENLASFGEIGLGGEIRPVYNGQERIKIAKQHNFTRLIVPEGNVPKRKELDVEIIGVNNLKSALEVMC